MGKHKKPASRRAVRDAEKGKERANKANERARKVRDLLRKQHSVPDK